MTDSLKDLANVHRSTVEGFGEEWDRFDQSAASHDELAALFDKYFAVFPWEDLRASAIGFDAGCGSGRWAGFVAPRVGTLYCVDASDKALSVARRHLADHANCAFVHSSVNDMPLAPDSMDFGYSLGVLHHVPDTEAGLRACVDKLKPGAPFLLYLYYAFDNRPAWYRAIWAASDFARRGISRMPTWLKTRLTDVIAAVVYWPLARITLAIERLGVDVRGFPLSFYRDRSFYVMRTDSLDRFGTRLERRFTAKEIGDMMSRVGLSRARFHQGEPHWCVVGWKSIRAASSRG